MSRNRTLIGRRHGSNGLLARRRGHRSAGRGALARCEGLEARRLLSAGDLDLAFGGSGYVRGDFAPSGSVPDVVVQWDGRIVVAGTVMAGTRMEDFAVARYNSDGTPDTTFSGDGKVTTDFGGLDSCSAVALGPGGRIVVAGGSAGKLAVAVFLTNGTPDTAFSGDGKLTMDLGGAYANDVAVQPDGKIVVAGSLWDNNTGRPTQFVLARLTTTGALDPTFSDDGKVVTERGGAVGGIAIDSANRIVLAGASYDSMAGDAIVARFAPDGSPDAAFSGGMVRVHEPETSFSFSGVAIQPDGRIVAVGWSSGVRMLAARLTADGALDKTFNGTGVVRFGAEGSATETSDWLSGVAIASDGKIVGVGAVGTYNDSDASYVVDTVVVRLNADGSLDPSFSGDGRVITDFGVGDYTDDYAGAVALQPDGRIVVAGSSDLRVLIARFQGEAAVLSAGSLYVSGTPGDDTIRLSNAGGILTARVNAVTQTFSTAAVSKIFVDAGRGNDRVMLNAGAPGARVDGGTGNDSLTGGNGNDTLRGGDGNDLLVGGAGRDWLEGDAGRDTADYSARTRDVRLSLDGVANDGEFGEADNVLGDVENLIGGSGNDVLVASPAGWGNELLDGRSGNDRLVGYQGNDQLLGGPGNDTLDGGPGNDTLIGGEGRDSMLAGEGADLLDGGLGDDSLWGGAGNDTLTGGGGVDRLWGDAGDDWLYARDAAVDWLDGGVGFDRAQVDVSDTRSGIEALLA